MFLLRRFTQRVDLSLVLSQALSPYFLLRPGGGVSCSGHL